MDRNLSTMILILRKDFKQFCSARLQEIGLSQGLLYFVLYIGKYPGSSPGQLCTQLGFDTGHTARSIDKLVSAGFVVKSQNPGDRRAHQLNLTVQGETAFQMIYSLLKEWDQEAMEALTEKEQRELMTLMEKVRCVKEGGRTDDTMD